MFAAASPRESHRPRWRASSISFCNDYLIQPPRFFRLRMQCGGKPNAAVKSPNYDAASVLARKRQMLCGYAHGHGPVQCSTMGTLRSCKRPTHGNEPGSILRFRSLAVCSAESLTCVVPIPPAAWAGFWSSLWCRQWWDSGYSVVPHSGIHNEFTLIRDLWRAANCPLRHGENWAQ